LPVDHECRHSDSRHTPRSAGRSAGSEDTASQRKHPKNSFIHSLHWNRRLVALGFVEGATLLPGVFQKATASSCVWPGRDSRSLALGSSQLNGCFASPRRGGRTGLNEFPSL